jgi:hypothetical protein
MVNFPRLLQGILGRPAAGPVPTGYVAMLSPGETMRFVPVCWVSMLRFGVAVEAPGQPAWYRRSYEAIRLAG